jgi:hypothetical protein
MPQDFLPIPDWFSWENQGAGVGVADLADWQHLVVPLVRHQPALVDAPISQRTGGTLTATVTGNPDLAPPGWYMLFLVDQPGVPSRGALDPAVLVPWRPARDPCRTDGPSVRRAWTVGPSVEVGTGATRETGDPGGASVHVRHWARMRPW